MTRLVTRGVVTLALLAGVVAWPSAGHADSGVTPSLETVLGGPNHAQIYPGGLEVTTSGAVVLADTGNDRVAEYLPDGSLAWSIGTHGTGTGQFLNPRDIGIDSTGNIYVADARNSRVVKLSPTGAWLAVWHGPNGDRMSFPLGITVTNDLVYVADTGRNKIRVFDTSGNQLRELTSSTSCNYKGLRDVDVDSSGNFYIANYTFNRVQQLTPSGVCGISWGGTGTTPGKLRAPYGLRVAHDPVLGQDAVYVAEANNGRISEFTLDGSVVTTVGSLGPATSPGTFFALRKVAVAANGDLWGADLWGWRLENFTRTPSGYSYASTIGVPLPAPTPSAVFHEARQVSFEGGGTIDVVDTVHHQIVRMSPSGQILGTCGGRGGQLGQFNWPRGVAVDPASGDLWVADSKQNRLQVIHPNCSGVALIGSMGTGISNFNWPYTLVIRATDETAWVADTWNNRIVEYDVASRTPITTFGTKGTGTGNLNQPGGIAIDPADGTILVADTLNNRIVRLTDNGGQIIPVGTYTASLKAPEGVAADASGHIFIADSGNNRVLILNSSGAFVGSLTTGLDTPEDVAVDASGQLYVSDTYHDRVLVYGPTPS